MKVAIITAAGISSRFNDGISENKKVLKAIYTKDDGRNTLLYHLLLKCRLQIGLLLSAAINLTV